MSVQFKMVAKQNNLVSPPEVKYYPCAVSRGEIDLAGLAAIISSRSTISKADCYGVIMALSQAIGESLSDGKIVRIESLGTFSLTLQGTAADAPQQLGKTNIKRAKIVYHPAKDLKNSVKKIVFKRIR